MKFNITPGPWNPEKQAIINAARTIEADINGESWKDKDNTFERNVEANARAIAAVPDMIEALSFIAGNSIDDTVRDFAEKVLVKAGFDDL